MDTSLLTKRERDCLRLVARDRGSGEIAAELRLAVGTVENHIKSARGKLGGVDRFTAARLVAEAEGLSHSLASLQLDVASHAPGNTIRPSSTAAEGEGKGECGAVQETRSEFDHSGTRQADVSKPPQTGGLDLANLTTLQRIVCIVGFAAAITIGFAAFVSAFEGISRRSISLPG
jgi:DNA-binding CsgD family transcriptional regulator